MYNSKWYGTSERLVVSFLPCQRTFWADCCEIIPISTKMCISGGGNLVEIHIESIEETAFQVFSRSYSGSMSIPQSGWHWHCHTNCLGVRIRVLLSVAISYIETQASVRHNFLLNTARHFTFHIQHLPFSSKFFIFGHWASSHSDSISPFF